MSNVYLGIKEFSLTENCTSSLGNLRIESFEAQEALKKGNIVTTVVEDSTVKVKLCGQGEAPKGIAMYDYADGDMADVIVEVNGVDLNITVGTIALGAAIEVGTTDGVGDDTTGGIYTIGTAMEANRTVVDSDGNNRTIARVLLDFQRK